MKFKYPSKTLQEFKEFAVKGNVVDMAVGVVIGVAFGTVVKSLVDDIITPPIGRLTGGADFTNLYINLSGGEYDTLAEAQAAGAATINYGVFINSVISFLIVAWALFMAIKFINQLKRKEPAPTPNTKVCQFCKTTINTAATRCPNCTSEI